MEELYDKVESYLAGELSPADRADFEAQLASDPELATEVALHRQLQETLADEGEWSLRQTLQTINGEKEGEPPNEKGNTGLRNLLIGTILICGLVAVWFFNQPEPGEPTEEVVPVTQEAPDTTSSPGELIVDTPSVEVPSEVPPPVDDPPPGRPQAQIDMFAPNPVLESLADSLFTPVYDLAGVVTLEKGSGRQKNFNLSGLLLTIALPEDSSLVWRVYDNAPARFPDQPLFTTTIIPELQAEDGNIAFTVKKAYDVIGEREVTAPDGRFYYTIALSDGRLIGAGVVE